MSELLEVFPRKFVVLAATPILLGLVLLALLFDLDATAWALILLVLLSGVLVLFVVAVRTVMLEKQRAAMEPDEEESED